MKRLFLIFGLMWGAIYIANHLVLPRPVSDGGVQPHKPAEQVNASRQIDSWGPYLPNSSKVAVEGSDENSVAGRPEKETQQPSLTVPAANPTPRQAQLNDAERSPLDNPGLPLRKPLLRDMTVAEQAPAKRRLDVDAKRRSPIAADKRVAHLERPFDEPSGAGKNRGGLQQPKNSPDPVVRGRPNLGLFIFAPPGF
jgi:hypothetical protein